VAEIRTPTNNKDLKFSSLKFRNIIIICRPRCATWCTQVLRQRATQLCRTCNRPTSKPDGTR